MMSLMTPIEICNDLNEVPESADKVPESMERMEIKFMITTNHA